MPIEARGYQTRQSRRIRTLTTALPNCIHRPDFNECGGWVETPVARPWRPLPHRAVRLRRSRPVRFRGYEEPSVGPGLAGDPSWASGAAQGKRAGPAYGFLAITTTGVEEPTRTIPYQGPLAA